MARETLEKVVAVTVIVSVILRAGWMGCAINRAIHVPRGGRDGRITPCPYGGQVADDKA
jgi:hypothetical protein